MIDLAGHRRGDRFARNNMQFTTAVAKREVYVPHNAPQVRPT